MRNRDRDDLIINLDDDDDDDDDVLIPYLRRDQRGKFNGEQDLAIVYTDPVCDGTSSYVTVTIPLWNVRAQLIVETGDNFPESAIEHAMRFVTEHMGRIKREAQSTMNDRMKN